MVDMEGITNPITEEGTMSVIATEIDAFLAQCQAEYDATLAALPTMKTRHVYRTGFGGELTVNSVSFGKVSVESVLDGSAKAIEATLTEDGRSAATWEWHQGPVSREVYYERWTAEGRVAHGYVDAESRRLVQAG